MVYGISSSLGNTKNSRVYTSQPISFKVEKPGVLSRFQRANKRPCRLEYHNSTATTQQCWDFEYLDVSWCIWAHKLFDSRILGMFNYPWLSQSPRVSNTSNLAPQNTAPNQQTWDSWRDQTCINKERANKANKVGNRYWFQKSTGGSPNVTIGFSLSLNHDH